MIKVTDCYRPTRGPTAGLWWAPQPSIRQSVQILAVKFYNSDSLIYICAAKVPVTAPQPLCLFAGLFAGLFALVQIGGLLSDKHTRTDRRSGNRATREH